MRFVPPKRYELNGRPQVLNNGAISSVHLLRVFLCLKMRNELHEPPDGEIFIENLSLWAGEALKLQGRAEAMALIAELYIPAITAVSRP